VGSGRHQKELTVDINFFPDRGAEGFVFFETLLKSLVGLIDIGEVIISTLFGVDIGEVIISTLFGVDFGSTDFRINHAPQKSQHIYNIP
jgi:hypothetical protein